MKKNIYLVRHCQTDWNNEGKTQGISDIPLNSNGLAQSIVLAQKIKLLSLDITELFASPLTRSVQTARGIADALGVEMNMEPLIGEFAFGIMEGYNFSDFGDRFKEEAVQWEKDPSKCEIPGAESFPAFEQRCRAFLELVKRHVGNAIVVTHSMVIKQLTRLAAGTDYTNFHKYACANGELIRLTYDEETDAFDIGEVWA